MIPPGGAGAGAGAGDVGAGAGDAEAEETTMPCTLLPKTFTPSHASPVAPEFLTSAEIPNHPACLVTYCILFEAVAETQPVRSCVESPKSCHLMSRFGPVGT